MLTSDQLLTLCSSCSLKRYRFERKTPQR